MQNDNKLAIGGGGGNQQRQQENNFRIGRLVRPPVRTEIRRPNRTLQPSTNASAASLQRNEAAGNRSSLRMSYLPSETAYRTIRADERDDSHIPVGRAGEIVQWNHNHGRARNDSAFATLSYRREKQMASYRMPESWRQVPEREWRRPIPSGVLRETASVATENLQMQQGPRSQGSWNTSALSNSPDAFRLSSSWSQGNFPTVAEINRHNKLQQARSSRGGIHVQTGAADDVQAISMSSSNGSSTTSPPHNAAVGNKRLNDAVAPPDPTKPTPLAPTIPSAFTSTNQKKQKISPPTKKAGFDMLNLLCSATLEVGPLQDNPSGCSCPKSKCVALYCDCFKAGRRCDKGTCSCLDCKNTVEESGVNGARAKAIRTILARNPRAFTTAGQGNPPKALPPGKVACNCIRSRCLKLYCGCFQAGKVCDPEVCTCIDCRNLVEYDGERKAAVQQCLEKRPNAFQSKPKAVGSGCACKNNRCIRKYCECFREGLTCTEKCICRQCQNTKKAE